MVRGHCSEPTNLAVLHGLFESVHYVIPRGLDQTASVAQLAEQLICNQQVAGSTPAASSARRPPPVSGGGAGVSGVGRGPSPANRRRPHWRHTHTPDPHHAGSYPSGQRGQTVNLMAYAFAGSNPALPSDSPFGDPLPHPPAPGRQRPFAARPCGCSSMVEQ